MTKRSYICTLAVLALLAIPARADAGITLYDWGPLDERAQFAVELGGLWWGGYPQTCVAVKTRIGIPADYEGEAWATATRTRVCRIHFRPDTLAGPWARLCRVAVHEIGHLYGGEHTATPGDPMNPEWVWSYPGSGWTVEAPDPICDGNPFALHEGAIAKLRPRCPTLDRKWRRVYCWQNVRGYRARGGLSSWADQSAT